jgi:ribosomal protein L36
MKYILIALFMVSCAPDPKICTSTYETQEVEREECTSMMVEGAVIDAVIFDGDGITGALIGSTITDCKMVKRQERVEVSRTCVDNPEYIEYMKNKQAK